MQLQCVRCYSAHQSLENPIEKLKSRDLVQAATSSALESHLATEKGGTLVPRTIYAGVDPSAASMHVGNLLPLLALLHLSRYGHTGLILVSFKLIFRLAVGQEPLAILQVALPSVLH